MNQLVKYIAASAAVLILGLSGTIFVLNKQLSAANKELGRLETTRDQLVDAVATNHQSVIEVTALLEQCVGDRTASEHYARAVADEMKRLRESIPERVQESVDEIRQEMEVTAAERAACRTLPPRTSKLLITAAARANRDQDSPKAGTDPRQ